MLVGVLIFNLFLMNGFSVAQEETSILKNRKNKRWQFVLERGGSRLYSVSLARRVGATNLTFGGGFGYGSFYSHSFERNIYLAVHYVAFARYQPFEALQLDFGPTLIGYFWTDDCSECAGRFVGLYFSAGLGHRFVFAGPWVRIGFADDRRHGSEFGTIWGLQVRLALSWGK